MTPRSPRRMERMREVLARRQPDLTVVLENIHDPHNVSAILRSCDAVGVKRVELLYTVEKFPRIGRKSSSSANKWLEVRRHTTTNECVQILRSEGFRIYATRIGPRSTSLYDLDLTQKIALVLGNEHRGVSDETSFAADAVVQIPMMGMIQSLNVSVAAAVMLYEALRQRMKKGIYECTALPADEFERLLREWKAR